MKLTISLFHKPNQGGRWPTFDQKPWKRSRKSQLFRLGKNVRLWRQKGLNFKRWFIKSDFLLSWAITYKVDWMSQNTCYLSILSCSEHLSNGIPLIQITNTRPPFFIEPACQPLLNRFLRRRLQTSVYEIDGPNHESIGLLGSILVVMVTQEFSRSI